MANIQHGVIARYDREKHLGFIEMEDGQVVFFLFDKAMHLKFLKDGGDPEHRFSYGDEVEFKMKPSTKERNKWEAYDLRFIRNPRREMLLLDAVENTVMRGYIKRINTGKLMIKHAGSYVFIPLQVSDWETDIDTVYTARIDEIVDFKLTQTNDIYKLTAVVTDAKFVPEYHELCRLQAAHELLQAALVSKNADGYFATLLDGKVDAFIPIQKELTDAQRALLSNLKKGDTLPVTIKQIYHNKKVSLLLMA